MRVENDDVRIGSSWRNPAIGRMEWLMIITIGVMLGGLLHDGARLLIVNAWANYQLEQFKAAQAKSYQEHQRQKPIPIYPAAQSPAHPSKTVPLTAEQMAEIENGRRERLLNSDECRFWMQQAQHNPSQKASNGVSAHCR